jgi:hypothetical protein
VRTGSSKSIFGQRTQNSRLLSYALLFLFIYSSTAEAVHHHGVVSRSLLAAANTVNDTGAVNNSSTPSAPQRSAPASECLVCQFQQNLSSAEIFTPLLLLAPVTSNQTFPIAAPSFRSATTSTPQGRGPPSIS